MPYELLFLSALALTCAGEVAALLVINYFWIWASRTRVVGVGVLASSATLPYLWFIFPYFFGEKFTYITLSELFAVLIEAMIYRGFFRTSLTSSLLISLGCNIVSFGLALIFFW